MEKLKVLQHNVLAWTHVRKNELCNMYRTENPDIILLNSTGQKDHQKIKMYQYNVYQRNKNAEPQAGIAIAVKANLKHKIIDTFQDDVLAVELETKRGPVIISTTYLPPRRQTFPFQDIIKIARKPILGI